MSARKSKNMRSLAAAAMNRHVLAHGEEAGILLADIQYVPMRDEFEAIGLSRIKGLGPF